MQATNNAVFVTWMERCNGDELMLNFLYKVPLKTRVFTTNSNVGRKYTENERGL